MSAAKAAKPKKTSFEVRKKMHNIGAPIVGVLAFIGAFIMTIPVIGIRELNVGDACPKETLQSVFSGQPAWNLGDDLGKVVLIDFWGTWCGGCKDEMPDLYEAAKELGKEKFHLVAVSDNNSATVDTWVKKYWPGYSDYISYVNDNAGDTYFLALGGNDSWPRNILVDQKGVVKEIHSNVTKEQVVTSVKQLLGMAPSTSSYTY